ncbi:hypothetical protein OC846_002581 [Tilletia horrida]|uniref:Uncharacterized protein n=1 Tax=Tilletia horrida TaxID=155126 RepID=A0AAN6JUT3_9BASI|nr:hypothetical protein OC846_002581 [Tilletia horrida]
MSTRRTAKRAQTGLDSQQRCPSCGLAPDGCLCALLRKRKKPSRAKNTAATGPTTTPPSLAAAAADVAATAADLAAAAVAALLVPAGADTDLTDTSPPRQPQEEHRQQLQLLSSSTPRLQTAAPGMEEVAVSSTASDSNEPYHSATAPSMPLTPAAALAPLPSSGAAGVLESASPTLQTIARAQIAAIDDDDEDDTNEDGNDTNEEDAQTDPAAKMTEKESRLLFLSTIDALAYVNSQKKYRYILDDKKRARVVREQYWRIVRDLARFSRRTGVEVFLASGRPEPDAKGLKQHVFASSGLCDEENRCMHDAANKMAEIWINTLSSYRERLIAKAKESSALLRQHQARHLADQERIRERDEALAAALSTTAALREENERLRQHAMQAACPPQFPAHTE